VAFRLRPESEDEALCLPACLAFALEPSFRGSRLIGFIVSLESRRGLGLRFRTPQALHLDFLPPDPQMSSHVPLRIAAVLGAIVGFSALSVCSWIYAVPWSPEISLSAAFRQQSRRAVYKPYNYIQAVLNPSPS